MNRKPVTWVGPSRKDIRGLPNEVKRAFGDADTDTYRAIYTVRFAEMVYVLHVFQKKSTQGTKTSTKDMELVRTRLKQAEEMYRHFLEEKSKGQPNEP